MQPRLDELAQQDPEPHWPRKFLDGNLTAATLRGTPGTCSQPGRKLNYGYADLTSDIALWRWEAAKGVMETELSNPRTVPALVDRLEHDPSAFIRKEVASRMLTLLTREPLVRSALQASAAEDEDRMVREPCFALCG